MKYPITDCSITVVYVLWEHVAWVQFPAVRQIQKCPKGHFCILLGIETGKGVGKTGVFP
jgi:hypothetical protein